jgi:UDP-N-acetylglucosamine 2-epimerase (non-hydrolysing)
VNEAAVPRLYFFVGTTAELIKVMPVMRACADGGLPFVLVASGQNDIRGSELLPFCGKERADVVLHEGPIRKSAAGLLAWFLRTFLRSSWRLRGLLSRHRRGEAVMVVHGDTVSTVMGAMLARLYGLRVAHVEAGLRSFDYLHPFPEEIDRVITSRLADLHLCPNAWAVGNLAARRGRKIDTGHNTLLDALALANAQPVVPQVLRELGARPYFVFVMHRQENLLNSSLARTLVETVIAQSRRHHCVFILHHLTEVALEEMGLAQRVHSQPTITAVRRLPYMEFMQVLAGCEYVVTDGGSNQEECYYLGKPCLVLRKVTERTEGLGANVMLSGLDFARIDEFLRDPVRYRRPPVMPRQSPSHIVAEALREAVDGPRGADAK